MRVIPIIILTDVKAPKLPEISIGRIYLIISGINVLNNPEHIPWNNLEIRNSIKLGISVKKHITNPITIVIIRHYLYIIIKYLLDFDLINIKANKDPIPPPKYTEPERSPLARFGYI